MLLSIPLVAALIDTQIGSYTALVVVALIFLPRLRLYRLGPLDLLALLAASWVILSPLWSYAPQISVSASRGGVLCFAYFVAVRVGISSGHDFERFAILLCWISFAYAVYFQISAVRYGGPRLAVDSANPNYTAAALAFGATVSLWIVSQSHKYTKWVRLTGFVSAALCTTSVAQTGSRAGLAGVVLSFAALLFTRRAAVLSRSLTALLMVSTALIPYVPGASGILADLAGGTEYSDALTRGGLHYSILSGREEIWESTRNIISESWYLGSGMDGYRLKGSPPVLAHSWGLEYIASVGLVGFALIAGIIAVAFLGRESVPRRFGGRGSALWNTITALAILPSMALSTHQWTLWAWLAIALWSRSFLLDTPRLSPDVDMGFRGNHDPERG